MLIREDDLSHPATQDLLSLHMQSMRADSPPGQSFALDLSGLRDPSVTVWSAWEGENILGIIALNQHDAMLGEIKSMRTHPDHLRRGVGAALLEHVIAHAKGRGLSLLSLETGSGQAFEAALTLYRKRGFRDGAAFAEYSPNGFSRYLHLAPDH